MTSRTLTQNLTTFKSKKISFVHHVNDDRSNWIFSLNEVVKAYPHKLLVTVEENTKKCSDASGPASIVKAFWQSVITSIDCHIANYICFDHPMFPVYDFVFHQQLIKEKSLLTVINLLSDKLTSYDIEYLRNCCYEQNVESEWISKACKRYLRNHLHFRAVIDNCKSDCYFSGYYLCLNRGGQPNVLIVGTRGERSLLELNEDTLTHPDFIKFLKKCDDSRFYETKSEVYQYGKSNRKLHIVMFPEVLLDFIAANAYKAEKIVANSDEILECDKFLSSVFRSSFVEGKCYFSGLSIDSKELHQKMLEIKKSDDDMMFSRTMILVLICLLVEKAIYHSFELGDSFASNKNRKSILFLEIFKLISSNLGAEYLTAFVCDSGYTGHFFENLNKRCYQCDGKVEFDSFMSTLKDSPNHLCCKCFRYS